ncbi:Lrp/AsnC family transcriptional regulator [Nocardia cerradoensis]|uniref:Lrp/AsnC family transcriptional regulator n=1 Tax=Nocardia cerradoensis TaxID=85688 RepID=UPI0003107F7D|nr:Lrp/AsnC family transcriptional regulator [Nocardia cerradoensis]NKY42496.1 Lrp/AsnC family transcriptional regulator [Nocardia cerradoensis]
MQDDVRLLTEEELALIHALQLRPRASWTDLGRVLGVDPVTVARRWQRLSDRGEAWISVSPGPAVFDLLCAAFIDIDCTAGQTDAVVTALAAHPHMLTLERAGGSNRILATIATEDFGQMSRYTLDVLPGVPHITAVRTRIVTHWFAEGGSWRIDALTPDQRDKLRTPPITAGADRSRSVTPLDWALIGELARDGRAPHSALAAAVGISASTAKRRIGELTRLGLLSFRCDFARPLGGWPVAVTFWATAPTAALPEIGYGLIRLPQTRNCAAVSGTHNLVLQAGLHSVAEIARFENQIATLHPELTVTQRTVTLRHEKLLGHILDRHGRARAVVPPDIWRDPAAASLIRTERSSESRVEPRGSSTA